MNSLSLSACCQLLSVDPKTLRLWLSQADIPLHSHPNDARIKCLTYEHVQVLAALHDRVLSEPLEMLAGSLPAPRTEADLRTRLEQVEAQVLALHTQLTDLALQLLKARQLRMDPQIQVLQTHQPRLRVRAFPEQADAPLARSCQPVLSCHPTEQRHALIPLIEYGARGRYVLLSPEEGELPIEPDSGEWFRWLASLSSFRFVGRAGRFSARRGYNRRPNRCWYAQRGIHQKNYSKYLGVSEHLTTERLEQVAAQFQAYLQ